MKADAPLIVAIDGPSASGKSTVARRVAAALGSIYVDSGSLYRALTWKALASGIPPADAGAVVRLMRASEWSFRIAGNAAEILLDGEYPGDALRGEPVRENVSEVAAIPDVRAFIVERLRETARWGSVTMEGRDIGTVVFPDTPFKFFLDADPEERARRRLKDIVALEGQGSVESVRHSLARRDRRDSGRAVAPLKAASDAQVLDTTGMTIEQVAETIVKRIAARRSGARHA